MLLFGTKARDVFKAWAKKDKQAQIEGTKRLGLPENNTAADRAKAMGFGDTQYHGTDADFTEFKVDPTVNYSNAHISSTPDPKIANHFSMLAGKYPEGAKVYPVKTRGNHFSLKDKEAVREVTDMIENTIGFEHSDEAVESVLRDLRGGNAYWKTMEHPMVRKALQFTGYDSFDTAEGVSKVINKANFNPSDVRSPLAHFNPKMAGIGGAGSVLSADLMAEETKPTESIWSSLMNTIGNVNQQQAQGTADIGAGAIEGTAGIAKMLATQPDLVAEVAGGGLLKAAGVVSPWIKGAGLGGVFYPSELGDGTLRDENGEYHPHVAQLKKEQQLDEYIASLTPDIHSTEIKLGR